MPRIRSLKPEHRQHRKVGPLSDRAYRLWVGMLLEADDAGRLVCEAPQLRAVVFSYHPQVSMRHIEQALEELTTVGLVRVYHREGVRYAEFPSWADHQRIDRPVPSKLPEYNNSTSPRRVLDESSTNVRQRSDHDLDLDRKGSEGRGGEAREGLATPPAPTSPVKFQIPTAITAALDRAPTLGAVARLRLPAYWQAEIRANGDVDLAGEILKAEAWLTANPRRAPRKDLARFLHTWLTRADRPEDPR